MQEPRDVRYNDLMNLNSFIGNGRIVEILRRAVARDRLPHAMIFSGPPGVGKCTLAVLLAQYINCLSPAGQSGCGVCPVCRRIAAVIETRYAACLTRKEGSCGVCDNCRARTQQHPDVRIIEPEKTTIGIEQIRDMIAEIAYQPFEARCRVIILDPADQMKQEAHNCLLKTLEEPPSRTVIILVTTKPHVLLETIRSRSRLLQFGGIPQRFLEQYLMERDGRSAEEARLAALFSGGSLSSARAFNTGEFREMRSQALRYFTLLLTKGSFAEATLLAASVSKDKDGFQLWLESAAAILQDVYHARTSPERIGQMDILEELQRLAGVATHEAVVSAIEWLKDIRISLLRNINRQLALEAMFLGITGGEKSLYSWP